jgi:ligand-binding sensor domain-containing protein
MTSPENSRARRFCRFIAASLLCILLAFLVIYMTGCSFNKVDTQQESLTPKKESPGVVEEATITQTATERALVSDNIRCIYAGPDSLWVGTDRGISVYHKKDSRWAEFHREDGLISDDVTAVAIDGKSVWVGTRFGASFYDGDKNTWTSFQKRDGLADNRISSIAVDGNCVWFGTESGISRYDKTLGAWSLKKEKGKEEPNKIRAIAVEAEYVWFGTQEGLRRYDKAKDSWNTYTEKDGLIQNHVSCIALSKDAVWVGTEKSGMSKYSRSNQTFTRSYNKNDLLESNFIKAIAVDASSIWFGSADNGLRRYITTVDTWSRYTTARGLVSGHITCLAVDGNDMWIGTYEHGLCRYNKVDNTWTSYSERDMLASNHIRSLDSTAQMVWIGTTEGLSRYDMDRKTWTTYTKASGLATDYITYVTVDKKTGTIWIGTPLGLGKFVLDIQPGNPSHPASASSIQYPASSIENPASRKWRFYTVAQGLADNFVNCVSVAGDDVWIATRGGLNLLRTGKLHTYLEGECVTAVISTGADVWAGTTHGLYRKNSDQDQFDRFPSVECYVNTLAINQNDQVLAGSREGLWIVDTKATGLGSPPGHILPDSNVRAIAADDDYIWIGTPQGIAQHPASSIQHPASSIEYPVSSISMAGDKVFLGTVAGLVIYNRKADQWETHKAYHRTQILREDNINWIELDGRYLWALNWSASQNGAILRFDTHTDTWIKYTKEEIPLSSEVPFITEVGRITVDADSVWFATNGGVLRYNKESDTWTHFTKSSGLPGHRALFVEIDPPNYVWVVFLGGVASHYDKRTGEWDTLQVTGAGFEANIQAVAFTEKYVWFSTGFTGVRRYERATGAWTSYSEADGMASREGPWILADGQDVWTAGWGTYSWVSGMGSGGVSKYDASSGKWAIYDRTRGLLATNGLQCGQVSDNYLWCFGYGGINRYSKEAAAWVSFTQDDGIPDFRVTAVAEDGKSLWIGTGSKGVARYHEASGAWTSFSAEDGLADNSINDYALKVDSKYVWAGTSKGLGRYDKERRTWTSFTKPANLASRRALAVAVEPRYVWVGTHCGLSRYDKRHSTWKHFQKEEEQRRFPWEMPRPQEKKKKENELVDNNVVGLSLDERYVWIATEAGVGRYDKVADRFESYTKENQIPSNDVRFIGENRSHVWIGTKNGISKHNILSDDKNAWETYNTAIEVQPMLMKDEYAKSLDNDDVRCLAVEENRVWVGTKTGVSLYDLRKGTWRTFRQKDGLASDEVSCIAVDGENIWFGSGRGVSMYDTRNGSWQVFTERDGLASDLITSIAVSERYICFGTFDKGITILHKAENEFTTYTKKHGLPHNGILSIAIDGDLIWIGTHGGLTRYDTITQTWTIYTEGFDWDGV